jgi:hypothetical protein
MTLVLYVDTNVSDISDNVNFVGTSLTVYLIDI